MFARIFSRYPHAELAEDTESGALLSIFSSPSCFLFLLKKMKEESGFLIAFDPLRSRTEGSMRLCVKNF